MHLAVKSFTSYEGYSSSLTPFNWPFSCLGCKKIKSYLQDIVAILQVHQRYHPFDRTHHMLPILCHVQRRYYQCHKYSWLIQEIVLILLARYSAVCSQQVAEIKGKYTILMLSYFKNCFINQMQYFQRHNFDINKDDNIHK